MKVIIYFPVAALPNADNIGIKVVTALGIYKTAASIHYAT
jgi:hypothetical protein